MSGIIKSYVIHILLFLILSIQCFAVEMRIPFISDDSERDLFQKALLEFILEKSEEPYEIVLTQSKYSQRRIIEELKNGNGKINLYWMGTSEHLEQELLPIRFPIYRGLVGFRIFIINKNDQVHFSSVRSVEDLKAFSGVQGLGWTDVSILEHSSLEQWEAQYDSCFRMINYGNRVDYFSRAVTEIFTEVESRIDFLPNLAVEKHLLLYFPHALFFFTNPENREIADILEKGFKKSYSDGSFINFFYNHPFVIDFLEKAELSNRLLISIPNPIMSSHTEAIPEEYWHDYSTDWKN